MQSSNPKIDAATNNDDDHNVDVRVLMLMQLH